MRNTLLGFIITFYSFFLLPSSAYAFVELTAVAEVVVKAAQSYKKHKDEKKTLNTILTAIKKSTAEIQRSLEDIQVMDIESCGDAITIDFVNFLNYSRDTQESFARNYLRCLTEANRTIDKASFSSIDRIGKAYNILAGITLFVHEYLGFTQSALLDSVKSGNKKIKRKLKPTCHMKTLESNSPERMLICRSYNGDSAKGYVILTNTGHISPIGYKERLEDKAGKSTSYAIAKNFLRTWKSIPNNSKGIPLFEKHKFDRNTPFQSIQKYLK